MAAIPVAALVGPAGVAGADTEVQMAPTTSAVTVPASSSNGAGPLGLTIEQSAIVPGSMEPSLPALPAGEGYLQIWLWPDIPAGMLGWDPITIPNADATVTTSAGTVGPAGADLQAWDSFVEWDFPVPMSTTSATLSVSAWSATAIAPQTAQEAGSGTLDRIPYTLGPLTITFQATQVATTTTTAPVTGLGNGVGKSHAQQVHRSSRTNPVSAVSPSSDSSTALGIGLGLGALVLLGGGAAAAVTLRRRRAFARADREGRLKFVAPPLFGAQPTADDLGTGGVAGVPGTPRRAGEIAVLLLGPLEIEGTKKRVTATPLLELITFLVLHPGKTFTSTQIRERIWGLGRQPLSSASLRTYLTSLRRALGPGVVVTERFTYTLTGAVTSDWAQFQAAVARGNGVADHEEAVGLVRGRVLEGCFADHAQGAFGWAEPTANDIELEVVGTAGLLALSWLEHGDLVRARRALAQGLLCSGTNLHLWEIDLRIAARQGQAALAGHLETARAALSEFPLDRTQLEDLARELGWESDVPS